MSESHAPDGPIESRRDGTRTVILVRGRIDSSAAEPLFAAVAAALREGPEEVALELAEVAFVSSAGIGGLLRSQAEARRAGVRFRVASLSEAVRGVLRLARIEALLLGGDVAPAAARPAGAATRTVSYDAWTGRFRPLDPAASAAFGPLSDETVGLGDRDLAIGTGCLGDETQRAEIPRRAGELLAVGRVAACLPTDTDLIDYLATGDGVPCPVTFADGLIVRGPMRWAIDLTQVRPTGVGLSELLRECLELCGSDAIAVVAAVEAAGVVGAHLRVPPGRATASLRERLSFTTEPLHEGDALVIAGIAARSPGDGSVRDDPAKGPLASALRPFGDGTRAHLHGLALSYRPMPIEPRDPAALARSLVVEQRPLGLYHLVHDDRPGGAGQTRLRRGTIFCTPLAPGHGGSP